MIRLISSRRKLARLGMRFGLLVLFVVGLLAFVGVHYSYEDGAVLVYLRQVRPGAGDLMMTSHGPKRVETTRYDDCLGKVIWKIQFRDI